MLGRIRTEAVCPLCGVRFQPVRHPLTKDVIDLMCPTHLTRPVKGIYVDARPFNNRKGTVGYLYRDERYRKLDSPMAAYRMLESIRHDWDKDPVAFDPEKWSQAGRRKHALSDVWASWHKEIERTRSRVYAQHIELFGRKHILPMLGTVDVREMKREDVMGLDEALQGKGLSPQTRRSALDILYSALKYARDNKMMTVDQFPPRPKVKVCKKKRRVLSPDEQILIRDRMPKRLHLFMDVLFATGARIGEVCALKREDVLSDRRIYIQRALDAWGTEGPPKNGESRHTSPLPVELYERLTALPVVAGYLFRNAHGRPYVTSVVWQNFRPIADKLGYGNVTPYTAARHSLATIIDREAYEEGKAAAAKRMGNTKRIAARHYVQDGGETVGENDSL